MHIRGQCSTSNNATKYSRELGIIFQNKSSRCNSTTIIWTADVDAIVLSFYDTKLRNNSRLRRSCTNRRVLNDTINQWKIERHLDESTTTRTKHISQMILVTRRDDPIAGCHSTTKSYETTVLYVEHVPIETYYMM